MCTEVGMTLKCQQLIKGFYVLGTCRIIATKVWFNRLKYLYQGKRLVSGQGSAFPSELRCDFLNSDHFYI